jgi:predicted nucleic acid-binding protein
MKLLLDANVLLRGILNPLSISAQIVAAIIAGKIEGFVLQHNIREAKKIIEEIEERTGVSLNSVFEQSFSRIPFTFLDDRPKSEINQYLHVGGRQDAPLAAVAAFEKIPICTNDPDFLNAKQTAIRFEAKDPAECLLIARNYELKPDQFVRGFFNGPDEGSIYLVLKSCWGSLIRNYRLRGLWCLLDSPGIGGLYLDLDQGGLSYFADNGPSCFASLHDCPDGDSDLVVVVTYKADAGLAIFRGHGKAKGELEGTWSPGEMPPGTRQTNLLSGRRGDFQACAGVIMAAGFQKHRSERAANNLIDRGHPVIPAESISLEEIAQLFWS